MKTNLVNRKEKFGHVYVIKFESGLVKIGKSSDPTKRLRCLENQSGFSIIDKWISPWCTNWESLEKYAHEYFHKNRCVGEYFSIDFLTAISIVEKFEYNHVTEEILFKINPPIDTNLENNAFHKIFSDYGKKHGIKIVNPDTREECLRLADYSLSLVANAFIEEGSVASIDEARYFALELMGHRADHLNSISCYEWTDVQLT